MQSLKLRQIKLVLKKDYNTHNVLFNTWKAFMEYCDK
jgi:hypothetical protein